MPGVARFPDGSRTLTVPADSHHPALTMTLHVDGNTAWSAQGTWVWVPGTQSYYCSDLNATVENDGNGAFSGAAGSTAYSGTWT